MAVDQVDATDKLLTGRIQTPPQAVQPSNLYYNADFRTAVDLKFNFTVLNSQYVFGVVKSMFVDNTTNPSIAEVYIEGTQVYFPVPAGAAGYFKIDSQLGASIRVVTDGGATDIGTIVFYNYDVPPVVWYKFGPINPDVPNSVRGEDGLTIMAPTNPFAIGGQKANGAVIGANKPVLIGGRYNTNDTIHAISVDATGALLVTFAGTIGGVTIADGADVAEGATTDAAKTDPTLAGTVLSFLKGLVKLLGWSATGTQSIVAAAVADTSILASNANRKGATVYNDSGSIMYLLVGAGAASATVYTVQLNPNAYYEVPYKYTGQIRAYWVAATGNARVMEYT